MGSAGKLKIPAASALIHPRPVRHAEVFQKRGHFVQRLRQLFRCLQRGTHLCCSCPGWQWASALRHGHCMCDSVNAASLIPAGVRIVSGQAQCHTSRQLPSTWQLGASPPRRERGICHDAYRACCVLRWGCVPLSHTKTQLFPDTLHARHAALATCMMQRQQQRQEWQRELQGKQIDRATCKHKNTHAQKHSDMRNQCHRFCCRAPRPRSCRVQPAWLSSSRA